MAKKQTITDAQRVRLSLKRLLILGGGLFVLGLIISAINWKLGSDVAESTNINIVKIDGKEFITEEDILKIIKEDAGQNLDNASVGRLNVKAIEKKLRLNPYVENADAYLNSKNQLFIEVQQAYPIVRIIDRDGRQYYLDNKGGWMPLSKSAVARVPVASGEILPYFEGYQNDETNILFRVFKLVQFIREDEFLAALVEQIHIKRDEDFIIVPKVGQQKINLGSDTELDDKFENLKIFYAEALPYKGWRKYKEISLAFDGQVVGVKK